MNKALRNILAAGLTAAVAYGTFRSFQINTPLETQTLESKVETPKVAKSYALEKISSGDVRLSNGMMIPSYLVRSIGTSEEGGFVDVDTEHGPEYGIKVFDSGDGKPYHYIEVGNKTWEGGVLVEDATHLERSFDLTYKFCDIHEEIPIWFPTAFRSDPCYGIQNFEGWEVLSTDELIEELNKNSK
jgi:hypothetical protein